jgi:hypothetical protein
MSARSSSVNTTAIASGIGALLTLLLHFAVGPEAAILAALLGFAATIGLSLSGSTSSPNSGKSTATDSATLDAFLKELKTIPAVAPQVRVEFNSQSAALQNLLTQLPENFRNSVQDFLDRATRRVRTGDSQSAHQVVMPTPAGAPIAVGVPQKTQPSATHGAGIRIDAILIDDEESVHMAWKVAAGRAGKTVLTFKSVEDILSLPGLSKIPSDTRIIVDAHLAQGTKGVVAAKQLFDKGFKNLSLAHPEPRKLMEPMPTWIQQITDKRPQFQ